MKIKLIKIIFWFLALFNLDKFADKIFWKYLHGFKPASKDTLVGIEKAFELALDSKVLFKGDYYEFGVFKGYSLFHTQKLIKNKNPNMRIFGFDSFEGLPELDEKEVGREFFTGQFAYSKENVIKNIKNHGGSMGNIRLIKGYFSDTLNKKTFEKYKMKKASIINIDSDLYSSAVEVLSFIKSLLLVDTVILFDDWNSLQGYKVSGEERALKEFLKKNPSIKLKKLYSYGWHGQAFKVVSL